MRRGTELSIDTIQNVFNRIIVGDCREALQGIASDSIDLIITSPPYAGKRQGISEADYIPWFLERSVEFKRVLKPTGSFVLNIKEGAKGGCRQTYVIKLILALIDQGWFWVEEYIWHKPNAFPGWWPNRFRDAWERCLHFTKAHKFNMYQDAVMVPIGKWAVPRLKNLSKEDLIRHKSITGSGLGRNVSKWKGRDYVYPDNVLGFSSEESPFSMMKGREVLKHHSAFPVALSSWFIKLFTEMGNIVLDPFVGSGTTAVAAKKLGRHYIGIDISEEFCNMAEKRLRSTVQEVPRLF